MLIFGFLLIVLGAAVAIYGNDLNNDIGRQLESILRNGQINSGDVAIYIGIALATIGVLLIIIELSNLILVSQGLLQVCLRILRLLLYAW